MKHNRLFKISIIGILCLSMFGCNSSKIYPLSPNDIRYLTNTPSTPWSPEIKRSINGVPVYVAAVLFDGTWNDCFNTSKESPPSIECHVYHELENSNIGLLYYRGVGTENSRIYSLRDAVFGVSMKPTAERAAQDVIKAIDIAREKQPNSDVRLLVSGFSRGGATARHFMNLIEEHWKNGSHIGNSPTFYALLYDTVSTGQTKNLKLEIPQQADIAYNFISMDERRFLFKPIKDIPDSNKRIVNIERPGVHSDIGSAYGFGIGSGYQLYTDEILMGMGLIDHIAPSAKNTDYRMQGKHDSRWFIERLLGVGHPDTRNYPAHREYYSINFEEQSQSYHTQWEDRMNKLQSHPVEHSQSYHPRIDFTVRNNGNEFQIIPPESVSGGEYYSNIYKTTLNHSENCLTKFYFSNNCYILSFDGLEVNGTILPLHGQFNISDRTLHIIPIGKSATLELAVTVGSDASSGVENKFWLFLNGYLVEEEGKDAQ